MFNTSKWKRSLLLAGKIALGSSIAIYTAELLNLQFSSSAGIVTLLTLVATKKGTLRLSAARILTFFLSPDCAAQPFERTAAKQNRLYHPTSFCARRCANRSKRPCCWRFWH